MKSTQAQERKRHVGQMPTVLGIVGIAAEYRVQKHCTLPLFPLFIKQPSNPKWTSLSGGVTLSQGPATGNSLDILSLKVVNRPLGLSLSLSCVAQYRSMCWTLATSSALGKQDSCARKLNQGSDYYEPCMGLPEASADVFHHKWQLGQMDFLSTHASHFKRQNIWTKGIEEEGLYREFDLCGHFLKCSIRSFLQEQEFGTCII